mmetsp:Transcript_24503/g.68705  ORF Transcript_24503/g.68705 Transcript_24503/m.68705 type:complete len:220 (+) Transcript_24503:1865-2524(+)
MRTSSYSSPLRIGTWRGTGTTGVTRRSWSAGNCCAMRSGFCWAKILQQMRTIRASAWRARTITRALCAPTATALSIRTAIASRLPNPVPPASASCAVFRTSATASWIVISPRVRVFRLTRRTAIGNWTRFPSGLTRVLRTTVCAPISTEPRTVPNRWTTTNAYIRKSAIRTNGASAIARTTAPGRGWRLVRRVLARRIDATFSVTRENRSHRGAHRVPI